MRDIFEIISDLDNFCIEGDYLAALSKLTDEVLASGKKEEALDAMISLLEKNPDEEIGSPGPLIHAIEKCQGFEEKLCQSVKRRPSTLAIWALYRVIEKHPERHYIEALKEASINMNASEQIREDAALLLSWLGES